MSGIRSKNTRPELFVRRSLHALGYRYRLHKRDIPGTPDLCLSRFNAVIFVNGCFWHGHDCHLFKVPKTRKNFWIEKISATRTRDGITREKLRNLGWRQLTVWECAIKGKTSLEGMDIVGHIIDWLNSGSQEMEITGSSNGSC